MMSGGAEQETDMFEITREEIEWGGRPLILETGKIARQADGAVLATYGETTVPATVVGERKPKPGLDFFPLTVNYQEKTYAAGKIPGGFFKREGRPSEKETLVSRLIDRPIRPLFIKGFKNETQVIATVLSHDMENDPDIVAMVAVSAALTISGLPFMGPIAAARVGYIGGEYKLNPMIDEMIESDLDLVVAGTADAVMMVESEAKELSEDIMLGAVMHGHKHFQPVIDMIIRLAEKCAKEPRAIDVKDNSALVAKVRSLVEGDLRAAYGLKDKGQRHEAISKAKDKAKAAFCSPDDENAVPETEIGGVFKEIESDIVRNSILDTKNRIDGRDLETVRPIVSQVGLLPRTHGSALFTRGETQALVVATLGTGDDEQFIDALEGTYKENFLLHYNFPPFSVGERAASASPAAAKSATAARRGALRAVLPPKNEFPTIRLVSKSPSRTAFVHGDRLRFVAGDDGCRCAGQARRRGHRHGPDPRRRALRGALRHSRRRGSPRRHGLQGGGHVGGRDLAADGHQDRRHHRRHHEAGARPGEGRPHPYPLARWRKRSTPPAPKWANMRRASKSSTCRPTRSVKSSARAARSCARSSKRPAPRSTFPTTARSGCLLRRRGDPQGDCLIQGIVAEPEVGKIYEGTV